MRGRYTRYIGVSVRDILDHLFLRYGKINGHDLIENMKRFHLPLYTGSPIDIYFKMIEDCREFEVDGNDLIEGKTIVNTELNSVHGTGLYNAACKDFKSLKKSNQPVITSN